MRKTIITSLAGLMAVLLLTGCQESESSQIQRARLVGRENLQLKKQIDAKETEIAQLKKDIEQLKIDKDKVSQQSGETNIRVLQIMAETENKNALLTLENEKLKAELEQLKSQ